MRSEPRGVHSAESLQVVTPPFFVSQSCVIALDVSKVSSIVHIITSDFFCFKTSADVAATRHNQNYLCRFRRCVLKIFADDAVHFCVTKD
jgi:hypothetical protein